MIYLNLCLELGLPFCIIRLSLTRHRRLVGASHLILLLHVLLLHWLVLLGLVVKRGRLHSVHLLLHLPILLLLLLVLLLLRLVHRLLVHACPLSIIHHHHLVPSLVLREGRRHHHLASLLVHRNVLSSILSIPSISHVHTFGTFIFMLCRFFLVLFCQIIVCSSSYSP